jgi:hypothetical protein
VDSAFLIVIAIGLCFLSGLIVVRMGAGGSSRRRTTMAVAELWLIFALWVTIFRWLGAAAGEPTGVGGAAEIRDLAGRITALPAAARVLALAGIAASVLLLAHLLRSVNRAMRGSI